MSAMPQSKSSLTLVKSRKKRPGANAYRASPRRAAPRETSRNTGRGAVRITLDALWGLTKRVAAVTLLLALLAGISVGLVAGYRFLTESPYFALNRVRVEGVKRLEVREVMELGGVALGRNVMAMNIAEVEERLTASPWVDGVVIRRELPDGLHIHVAERVPAFWVLREGRLFYVDADGKIIERVAAERFASLPLLELGEGCAECTRELRPFQRALERRELFFGLHQVAELSLSGETGLGVGLDGGQGLPDIRLGVDLNEWQAGFGKLERVLADLERRGETGAAATLTARGDKVWVGYRPLEIGE